MAEDFPFLLIILKIRKYFYVFLKFFLTHILCFVFYSKWLRVDVTCFCPALHLEFSKERPKLKNLDHDKNWFVFVDIIIVHKYIIMYYNI